MCVSSNNAPLSNSLFMIARELPTFLSTAYSIKYTDKPTGNILCRTWQVFKRYLSLTWEIISYRPSAESFKRNIQKLKNDFNIINVESGIGNKPICIYVVSNQDQNGAILGDHLVYYHHYKIKEFQKHYDVFAKVTSSYDSIVRYVDQIKKTYPNRSIEVVDIVAHGSPDSLDMPHGMTKYIKEDDFKACANDATIILDACSTGVGDSNIALEIAKNNRGKTVLAPGAPLFFSKPIFRKVKEKTFIDYVVHGFAIFKAYTSKKFCFPVEKPQALSFGSVRLKSLAIKSPATNPPMCAI